MSARRSRRLRPAPSASKQGTCQTNGWPRKRSAVFSFENRCDTGPIAAGPQETLGFKQGVSVAVPPAGCPTVFSVASPEPTLSQLLTLAYCEGGVDCLAVAGNGSKERGSASAAGRNFADAILRPPSVPAAQPKSRPEQDGPGLWLLRNDRAEALIARREPPGRQVRCWPRAPSGQRPDSCFRVIVWRRGRVQKVLLLCYSFGASRRLRLRIFPIGVFGRVSWNST